MTSNLEIILRLILSALTGGLIGAEREINKRPAGLRTHILVSVGSTLIMLVSKYGFDNQAEPARLAAQVVSGIGFLGAGTILRTGDTITGLTTAASLWVCAGIGLAIGSGYYLGAIVTTVIVLISLMSLGVIENKGFNRNSKILEMICTERPGLIGDIGTTLGNYNIIISDIKIIDTALETGDNTLKLDIRIKTPSNFNITALFDSLYNIVGVKKIIYDGNAR